MAKMAKYLNKSHTESLLVSRAMREGCVEKHQEMIRKNGFLKMWKMDPELMHKWEHNLLSDSGSIGPIFSGLYDINNVQNEKLMSQVVLKGLKNTVDSQTTWLKVKSSFIDGEEVEIDNNKHDVEIDLELLYKLQIISRHDSIAYIFGVIGVDNAVHGCHWFLISEEFETNETLQTVTWNCSQKEFPAWFERAHWCVDLANAVHHLHVNGLIHGNLKSSNCLLYKTAKKEIDNEMSPMVGDTYDELKSWEKSDFRRIRLTDMSCIRNIRRKDVLVSSRSCSSRVRKMRSISDLKEKMKQLRDELKRIPEHSRDEIYDNKEALFRFYQDELDKCFEDIEGKTEGNNSRKRLPSATPSRLRFWHARSRTAQDLNADIKSDNDLLQHKSRTPLLNLVNATKKIAIKTRWNPWMSPESISCIVKESSEKSDIYAFGIILNEIVTIRKPFGEVPWDQNDNEGSTSRDQIRFEVLNGRRPSKFDDILGVLSLSLSHSLTLASTTTHIYPNSFQMINTTTMINMTPRLTRYSTVLSRNF
jgi:serine/threonine protein kinase